MFIYLTFLYVALFFLFISLSSADELVIKDSGIGPVNDNDIAIIFYVTLENQSDKDFEISVCMAQCCNTMKQTEMDYNSMSLIGGDMGILPSKCSKNVTLVFPNLYLTNRQGICTINIHYRSELEVKQKMTRIDFSTVVPSIGDGCEECPSSDMEPKHNCRPVDCAIKYAGTKSYFDQRSMECVSVTQCISPPDQCVPEIGYSIAINNCTNLNSTIGKEDLQALDNNVTETSECVSCPLSNIICHHGSMDSNGQCECDAGWVTTIDEEIYSPTVLLYHMCNVEVGAWNCLNKGKIRTTTILIALFAVTIASKILILMCILNWCYKRYKHNRDYICSHKLDPSREEIVLCEDLNNEASCVCDPNKKKLHLLETQTVNISYYPCLPSAFSSLHGSSRSGKCNKCSANSDESIMLSKTTSGSVVVSFETESEVATEVSEHVEDEGNYDVEFSEGMEECIEMDDTVREEEFYGEVDEVGESDDAEIGEEEVGEQSDYTGYGGNVSRKELSSSKSKSSSVRKSKTSCNTKEYS